MEENNDNSLTLLLLPSELLIAIVEYVPSRWDVALVCVKFYEIVSKIERYSLQIVLKDEKMLLDTPTFTSIMNSKRDFDSLKISITTRMTNLAWERLDRILEIVKLRNLSIINFDPRHEAHIKIVNILMKCPANIIKDLSLKNINLDVIKRIFSRQRSIDALSITGAIEDAEFINNLTLKHLKLIGPKTKQLATILSHQRDLISLKLTLDEESDYNNEVFFKILQLNQLQSLDVPLNNNISSEMIPYLGGLKALMQLNISCSQACFQHLIMTSIPSLNALEITLIAPASVDTIKFFALNFPNLTSIKLRGPLVVNFLNDINRYFKNLECLWIENDESYYVNILSLDTVEKFNEKLKHLFIINHDRKVVICKNDLTRFVKMFSKLETLVLSKFIEIHLNNFEVLLRHLPGLQEIIFDSKCIDSTTSIMKVISLHGKSLKFVMLENFKHKSDIESLRVFFEGKFTVIEKKDRNLLLRVSEKMFLNKIMS